MIGSTFWKCPAEFSSSEISLAAAAATEAAAEAAAAAQYSHTLKATSTINTTTTVLTMTTTTTTIITSTTTSNTIDTTTISTTTATATTTTTTVYPCSVCAEIYNGACQGYNMPSSSSYCLTADEVPITYTLGPVTDHALPADTCSTRLSCPSGTAARVDQGGYGYVNGNADGSPTLVYCSETDGNWYADVDGYVNPVTNIACQHP